MSTGAARGQATQSTGTADDGAGRATCASQSTRTAANGAAASASVTTGAT
jgi:hypothetical protein